MSIDMNNRISASNSVLSREEKHRLRQTFGAKNLETEILRLCHRQYQVMQTEPYDLASFFDILETINRLVLRYGKYTRGATPSPTLAAGIDAVIYRSVRFLNEKILSELKNDPFLLSLPGRLDS